MTEIGLFVIPIRFDTSISTYNEYLDFLCEAENHGYTHYYIGEHLTDEREDIQSSLIFSAALLARTKKITICLSVLPLPHYDIKLLVKQLEDLYKLGNGRIRIGFSPGALKSDADYLKFDHYKRGDLFKLKLKLLEDSINSSEVLRKIPKSDFFSTLLSEYPVSSSLLLDKGYSAISSNFAHISYLKNHFSCMVKNNSISNCHSKWHITMNLVNKNNISEKAVNIIKDSLFYIYKKLESCKVNVMLPVETNLPEEESLIKDLLYKENVYSRFPYKVISEISNHKSLLNHPIINLFDCINDAEYAKFIFSLPSRGKIFNS